ncbi:hypothetical protein [Streptomyces echinatus]|uniref:Uncharacterized protein n=1 Tax=Streptomyces echinatus TaxID=67293 RepID=A0A7W9Q3P7_9ACTN|nr:hypothetical protein [Streptomyces echinatus]MBB5932593.1 hypothetical protein [Streptomyces echinatus]
MTPALDERARVRAAMDRILAGNCQHSNGALTIVALAQEAQVPRNALTQHHPDLKNDFYAKVKERGQPTDSERRLRKKITGHPKRKCPAAHPGGGAFSCVRPRS